MISAKELRMIQNNQFNYNNFEREIIDFVKNNPSKRSFIYTINKGLYPSFKLTMTKLDYKTMSFDETKKEFVVKISW